MPPLSTPEIKAQVAARMDALRSELGELEKAAAAFGLPNGQPRPAPTPQRRRRRREARPTASILKGLTRKEQALRLLADAPDGLTAAQMSKLVGVRDTIFHRPLKRLAEEGKVKKAKDGRWKIVT